MLPNIAPESDADRKKTFSQFQFLVILALAFAALFPRVIAGSATFFYRDFGVLAYPTIAYQHDCFWRGEVPLWNPYSNCGVPFLAQWGTMVLYPFSLLYLLFPIPWSLNVFCLGHLVWAALGMRFLARRWTGNPMAGNVAGLAFVFSGVTLSCLMWPNYCVALAWMPWVIACVERTWEGDDRRLLVVAALAASFQLLAGVPEIVLLTWLTVFGLWLIGSAGSLQRAQRACVIVLLAAGLTAVQLLPFIELLQHSQRISNSTSVKWGMPLSAFGNFLLPLFRCAQSPQGMFFQLGQDFFASTYLGVIPLALAILALFSKTGRRVWLLGGLTLGGLLIALADQGYVYPLVRRFLPAFGMMRYPIKFVILPAFAIPLLSAFGMSAILDSDHAPRVWRRFLEIVSVLAVGIFFLLWLTGAHPGRYDQWPVVLRSAVWRIAALLLGGAVLYFLGTRSPLKRQDLSVLCLFTLVIGDSLLGVPDKNPVLPASVLTPGFWQLQNKLPAPKLGQGRVMISPAAEEKLLQSQVRDLEGDFIGKRLALWSHLNLLDTIPKVNGSSTLQIKEQKQLESILYASPAADVPALRRFLSVVDATAPGQVVEWTTVSNSMPLITAGQRPLFLNPSETLATITNAAFDPGQVVVLPPEASGAIQNTNSSPAKVLSWRVEAHQIDCAIEGPETSLCVVAQSNYGPWHAYVDGKRTRLWTANYAFQALEVPAGRHQVQLKYEDDRFRLGLVISAVSLLICSCLWFWPRIEDPSAKA